MKEIPLHPLDMPIDLLDKDKQYHWVAFSIDKDDSFRLDVARLEGRLNTGELAYISNLIRFKEQIIGGYTPIAPIGGYHHNMHDLKNNQVKYGGLILCAKPKEQTPTIYVNKTAEAINKVLAQGHAEIDALGGKMTEMTISDKDSRR